ncbi:MAG TPA: hypothetical protein PKA82_11370, partial [Pyrinomonadaceae bacterium]|nr:hypothetical protein [Pyrinomonadaceae bacterium]
ALTSQTVRHDVAMTGEITLRGKVLPIGGVKEKLLAAHRFGLRTIVLSKENEKDLADVPDEVRDELTIHTVDMIDEVLGLAIERPVLPAIELDEDVPAAVWATDSTGSDIAAAADQ